MEIFICNDILRKLPLKIFPEKYQLLFGVHAQTSNQSQTKRQLESIESTLMMRNIVKPLLTAANIELFFWHKKFQDHFEMAISVLS